jgi:hypothetical protein
LLIIGCAFTSKEVFVGKMMLIPLKSSPQGARVLLDGRQEGFTPLTLKYFYIQTQHGDSDDEIRERILKIDKDGYAPYTLSFSIKDKEYKKIPNPLILKKIENIVKAEDSLGIEQQKRKELEAVVESLKALKEIEEPKNKIGLTVQAVDSAFKDQQKKRELKEAKGKFKESLKQNTELRKEFASLKEKDDAEKIKQNHNTIEALSDKEAINNVQAKSDKKIDNTKKVIKKLKVDSQYASRTTYTIQIGSHIKKTDAQKQFNSIIGSLDKINLNLFRIEKVGKYYTVRLGTFDGSAAAEKFLQSIRHQLSAAIILKAYIKNERIIKLYGDE